VRPASRAIGVGREPAGRTVASFDFGKLAGWQFWSAGVKAEFVVYDLEQRRQIDEQIVGRTPVSQDLPARSAYSQS
jgi:hypothetical protein